MRPPLTTDTPPPFSPLRGGRGGKRLQPLTHHHPPCSAAHRQLPPGPQPNSRTKEGEAWAACSSVSVALLTQHITQSRGPSTQQPISHATDQMSRPKLQWRGPPATASDALRATCPAAFNLGYSEKGGDLPVLSPGQVWLHSGARLPRPKQRLTRCPESPPILPERPRARTAGAQPRLRTRPVLLPYSRGALGACRGQLSGPRPAQDAPVEWAARRRAHSLGKPRTPRASARACGPASDIQAVPLFRDWKRGPAGTSGQPAVPRGCVTSGSRLSRPDRPLGRPTEQDSRHSASEGWGQMGESHYKAGKPLAA